MDNHILAMPRRVQSLSKTTFSKSIRLITQDRLLRRYHRNKDNIDLVDGVKVHSYYDSHSKTRFFYSFSNKLELVYYSQLSLSDSRGFFDSKFKVYYQSLVWTDPELRAQHRGFARSVIYDAYPKYVDTLIITDRLQTYSGYYMWKNIIYEAINHGFSTFAYIYDKKRKLRYVCKLTQSSIRQYYDDLDILFGDDSIYEDCGFIITKNDVAQYMINNIKVEYVPILEFINEARAIIGLHISK